MRTNRFSLVAFCCLALAADIGAQHVPAIPMTVKALVKSPPRMGQLIKVNGFLDTSEQEPNLRDTDSNRRILLDFSRSSVPLTSLGESPTGSHPVLIIGRMQGIKDKGKPAIAVIGAIKLTP